MLLAVAAASAMAAAPQQGAGPGIVLRLQVTGDVPANLAPLRACVAETLGKLPDVKVVTEPGHHARFVVDIAAAKAGEEMRASLVVAQTFPIEEFRPRLKPGEDAEALLKTIPYFTLQRVHELLPAAALPKLCATIAADIDKVLSHEYTARDD